MIPRPALYLGLAGLIPFIAAAGVVALRPTLPVNGFDLPLLAFGHMVLLAYGRMILAFMSGVLWGFAAHARRAGFWAYAASVIPALWVFFTSFLPDSDEDITLAIGFAALLALDWAYSRAGLAPSWWMPLRLLLTGVVLACLAVSIFMG
ncbi:MAG: DUF3429 domain-containing protein [Cypionkella sp.]|nr:DUF3429 domain-containing protein [Cypionkella sp.]